MVKLTADVIEQSPQYTNPLRDREIDLRGCKISVIENLGATLDQFDCIDMSDNDIKKVEGFPLLKRLRMLLLNNNRVCHLVQMMMGGAFNLSRFEENLELVLPQLETLILTNNNIAELADIDPLSTVKSLTSISLLRNPITNKPNYRNYIIYKLPQVRIIDFQRVRMKERDAAKKMFSGKKGEVLRKEIAAKRSKAFEIKDVVAATKEDEAFLAEKYKDQEAIKVAISNATTLEEVRKLELLLQQGYVPGKTVTNENSEEYSDINEVEMDE